MLVFSTNKVLFLTGWSGEYKLITKKNLLRIYFQLIDKKGIVAHESTLYRFTPLAISMGHFSKVIGNCKTHKAHQGKGLYGCVVSHIVINHCNKKPILFVDDNNTASIKGLEKIGFEKVDRFRIKNKYLSGLFYTIERY